MKGRTDLKEPNKWVKEVEMCWTVASLKEMERSYKEHKTPLEFDGRSMLIEKIVLTLTNVEKDPIDSEKTIYYIRADGKDETGKIPVHIVTSDIKLINLEENDTIVLRNAKLAKDLGDNLILSINTNTIPTIEKELEEEKEEPEEKKIEEEPGVHL